MLSTFLSNCKNIANISSINSNRSRIQIYTPYQPQTPYLLIPNVTTISMCALLSLSVCTIGNPRPDHNTTLFDSVDVIQLSKLAPFEKCSVEKKSLLRKYKTVSLLNSFINIYDHMYCI